MSGTYEHTQRSRTWLLFCGAAAFAVSLAVLVNEKVAWVLLTLVALVLVVASLLFTTLTVRDAGEHLDVRYGTVPLLGTRIAYADVRSVRRARSKWIDGWGIHWLPGRGWTYNLSGRDCVELEMPQGIVRVGTDDPEGLFRFLTERTTGR